MEGAKGPFLSVSIIGHENKKVKGEKPFTVYVVEVLKQVRASLSQF